MSSEDLEFYEEAAKLKKRQDVDYIAKNTEGFSLDHLKALIQSVYFEKKDLDAEIQRLKDMFRPGRDSDSPMGL